MSAISAFVEARPSLVRRRVITAGALTIVGVAARPSETLAKPNNEISRTEEAIHQVRVFHALRQRVFAALTVESQFDKIIQLSGVMNSKELKGMRTPTSLSAQVGSSFALFGGFIVGRQIELIPNELIVQAWRVLHWPAGMFSIARFALSDQDGSTKLVFNHAAFPKGQAEELASGWQENYWNPLLKFLA